ncbi:MAG: hypothetical protein M3036_14775, partial [Bifidobacteriales bacterium]|nr:hypothetical protein [Bifidobacteriales bacterium]
PSRIHSPDVMHIVIIKTENLQYCGSRESVPHARISGWRISSAGSANAIPSGPGSCYGADQYV